MILVEEVMQTKIQSFFKAEAAEAIYKIRYNVLIENLKKYF